MITQLSRGRVIQMISLSLEVDLCSTRCVTSIPLHHYAIGTWWKFLGSALKGQRSSVGLGKGKRCYVCISIFVIILITSIRISHMTQIRKDIFGTHDVVAKAMASGLLLYPKRSHFPFRIIILCYLFHFKLLFLLW